MQGNNNVSKEFNTIVRKRIKKISIYKHWFPNEREESRIFSMYFIYLFINCDLKILNHV